MIATIAAKGRLTLPKRVRDRLGIRPGTKVGFEFLADGSLRLRVLARGAANLYGVLYQRDGRKHTVEEMDRGIADAVVDRANAK